MSVEIVSLENITFIIFSRLIFKMMVREVSILNINLKCLGEGCHGRRLAARSVIREGRLETIDREKRTK